MMGIKKTSSIKNKFFEAKPLTKLEDKIHHHEDQEMEVEEEKETIDYDMKIDEEMQTVEEMEIDIGVSQQSPIQEEDMDDDLTLEDVKSKRNDR